MQLLLCESCLCSAGKWNRAYEEEDANAVTQSLSLSPISDDMEDMRSPCLCISGNSPEALWQIPCHSLRQVLWACSTQEAYQERYPKHQRKGEWCILIWPFPLLSKQCGVTRLTKSILNVTSVFLYERCIHPLPRNRRQGGKLQRLLAQSAGVSPIIPTQPWQCKCVHLRQCWDAHCTGLHSPCQVCIQHGYFWNTFTNVTWSRVFVCLPAKSIWKWSISLSTLPKHPQGEIYLLRQLYCNKKMFLQACKIQMLVSFLEKNA